MATPSPSLRHRGGKEKSKALVDGDRDEHILSQAYAEVHKTASKEWDYKLALGVITLLAFATRFFGISHPNEVVFDEVHFGKVRSSSMAQPIHHPSDRE